MPSARSADGRSRYCLVAYQELASHLQFAALIWPRSGAIKQWLTRLSTMEGRWEWIPPKERRGMLEHERQDVFITSVIRVKLSIHEMI